MEHIKRTWKAPLRANSEVGSGLDSSGHRCEWRAVFGIAGHRLGRDGYLCGSRPGWQGGLANHGARCFRRACDHRGGLLVAIPSMFAYNWLVHTLRVPNRRVGQFRARPRLENGDRVFEGRMKRFFATQLAGDVERDSTSPRCSIWRFVLLIYICHHAPDVGTAITLQLPSNMGGRIILILTS